jgi:hydroxymethylbilane synthase
MEGYRELFQEISEDRYYDTASIPTPKFDSEKLKAVFVANIKAFEQTLIWCGLRQPVYTDSTVLRIGARSSELSKAQVAEIEKLLRALNENMVFEQVYYDTPGDRDKDTPLPEASSDDFFTRDIDEALLAGEIDIAVHSTKDLPEKLRTGLRIAAITPSMAPWDCLVSKNDQSLMSLPAGATIGTSSIKRRENVARLRPDLKTVDIRGDVPERIKQLDEGRFDALVLASVGLLRLGLADRITEIFSKSSFPYTPGQGSLSLVTRENDSGLIDFLRPLDLGQGCFKQ